MGIKTFVLKRDARKNLLKIKKVFKQENGFWRN